MYFSSNFKTVFETVFEIDQYRIFYSNDQTKTGSKMVFITLS